MIVKNKDKKELHIQISWAYAENWVVGSDGRMLFDAKLQPNNKFNPVIMGRKIFERIPKDSDLFSAKYKLIVMSRDPDWQADGAHRAGSISQAVDLCEDEKFALVIGGRDTLRLFEPLADYVEFATRYTEEWRGRLVSKVEFTRSEWLDKLTIYQDEADVYAMQHRYC